ncbi:MAG: YciI family protein [Nocardioidaceae bacterium]
MTQTFMFLLYGDDSYFDTATEESIAADLKRHEEFTAAVEAAGAKIVGGEALRQSTTATTVRRDSSDPVVTDGPFMESKEALGGFYVIEAADLEQAIELAKVCPEQAIEVRPVWDMS